MCIRDSYYTVSQKEKKLSLPERQPTQCGTWRHTKQPYVSPLFVSHQGRGIFDSKVPNFDYFCIIFSFVVILMKNFEINIINRYYREETREFFFRIFRSYFPAENDVFFWKNVLLIFFNLGNQRLGIR